METLDDRVAPGLDVNLTSYCPFLILSFSSNLPTRNEPDLAALEVFLDRHTLRSASTEGKQFGHSPD